MLLLYVIIGIFLILGFGSAIYMGKRFKKQVEEISSLPTTTIITNNVDLEPMIRLLASELSKQFAKELRDALKDLQLTQPTYQGYSSSVQRDNIDSAINIDDRLIPMAVSTEQVESKVSFNQKTESVDTKLSESKNKLASFLKKKDK